MRIRTVLTLALVGSIIAGANGLFAGAADAEPAPPRATQATLSELRELLPADCSLLFEAGSLRKFAEEIAHYVRQFEPKSTAEQVMKELTQDSNLPPEFTDLADMNGPVGMAGFDPKKSKKPVMLFRIRDQKKFLSQTVEANTGEGPDKDGLWWYAPGAKTYHFTILNGMVVLSEYREWVKAIATNYRSKKRTHMPPTRLQGVLQIFIDLEQFNATKGKKLREQFDAMKAMAAMRAGGNKDVAAASAKMLDGYANLLFGLLDSSRTATVALQMDPKGITFNLEYETAKDSPAAKVLAKINKPNQEAMKFLPANTVFAVSADLGGTLPSLATFVSELYKEILKGQGKDKAAEALQQSISRLMTLPTGQIAGGWMPPKDGMGFGTGMTLLGTKDPAAYIKEMAAYNARLAKILKEGLQAPGQPFAMEFSIGSLQKAFEYNGTTVWKYAMGMNLKEDPKKHIGGMQKAAIKSLFGMFNQDIYLAGAKNYVISCYGSDAPAQIKSLLETVGKGQARLTKSPAFQTAFRGNLSGAVLQGTVDLVSLLRAGISMGVEITQEMGAPKFQVDLMKGLIKRIRGRGAASGFMLKVNASTLTGEIHIPREQIDDLISIVQNAQKMFQPPPAPAP